MLDSNKKNNTKRIVYIGVLIAIIVVLQILGTLLTGFTGLPMSFVLIPIVVGAVLISPNAGAILGASFGLITVLMGLLGLDKFTSILMYDFGTWKMIVVIILCFAKAALAGYVAGIVHKLLTKIFKGKKDTLVAVISSISAPIVNTGIFVVGMLLFFFNDMDAIQLALDIPPAAVVNATRFIFLVLAGWNFVSEFIINLVISPAVLKVASIVVNKKK